jgi:hypothetical protein
MAILARLRTFVGADCRARPTDPVGLAADAAREVLMGSSSNRRQTMAKMTRERMVKERRARKQEKKEEKKRAAAERAANPAGAVPEDSAVPPHGEV